MRPRLLSLPLLFLVGFVAAGCITFPQPRGVRIASDPPGATILVDGVDTGFLTPAFLDLDEDDSRIDLELAGYETATRIVLDDTRLGVVLWKEMSLGPHTWRCPLWLDYEDFLGMVMVQDLYRPTRLFVRMRLSGDS